MGTARPWTPAPSASRRSCWSSTRPRAAVTSRAREVVRRTTSTAAATRPASRRATSWTRSCSATSSRSAPTRRTTSMTSSLRSWLVGGRPARPPAALDLAVAVCASVPLAMDEPVISDNERYRDMAETFGQVARRGTTCGMHVHVAIESAEEGVCCIDRITPWLPILLAVSANSPYDDGRDTGYASWRTQLSSTWPSAGPTERVRLARRLPPRVRADDRQRRGPRSGDALLRRAPVRGPAHAGGPHPRRGDRPAGRRHAHRAGPGTGGDRGRRLARGPAGLASRGAAGPRGGGRPATGWPTACSTRSPTPCGPPERCSSRLVDLVAGRLEAATATASGWRAAWSGCWAATGATRQRAAYERTGSLRGRR